MNSRQSSQFELRRHPDCVPGPARAVSVRLAALPDGGLRLHYDLKGEIARIRLPVSGHGGRADELWRHTCCELFLAYPGDGGYAEYNFSPCGQWAGYRFSAYREPMPTPEADLPAPHITCRRGTVALRLEAGIHLAAPLPVRSRIALAAVVEDVDGGLDYWALSHPPGKPDFHHPDAFRQLSS